MALIDLFGSCHGQYLGNIRLYLDPDSQLVKPIGFDVASGHFLTRPCGVLAFLDKDINSSYAPMVTMAVKDPLFRRLYEEKVRRFATKKYLDALIKRHRGQIEADILLLRANLPRPVQDSPMPGDNFKPSDGASHYVHRRFNLNILRHNQAAMLKDMNNKTQPPSKP